MGVALTEDEIVTSNATMANTQKYLMYPNYELSLIHI